MRKLMSVAAAAAFVCGIAVQSFAGSLETQKNNSGLKFSEMKQKGNFDAPKANGEFKSPKKAALSMPALSAKSIVKVPPLKNDGKERKGAKKSIVGTIIHGGTGAIAGGIAGAVAVGAVAVPIAIHAAPIPFVAELVNAGAIVAIGIGGIVGAAIGGYIGARTK